MLSSCVSQSRLRAPILIKWSPKSFRTLGCLFLEKDSRNSCTNNISKRYRLAHAVSSCYSTKTQDVEAGGQRQDSEIDRLKEHFGPLITLANPWESSNNGLGNLYFFPPLDYASRHIIQLLQELNATGFHQSGDFITLDRCKHVLRGLLNHHRIHKDGADSMEQCAYRAYAILQNMQVFWDRKTFGPVHKHFVAGWPSPDLEVYSIVLEIFRKTSKSTDISFPRMAQAIMDDMNTRFEDHGELEFKAEPIHWNSVLICWNNCTHWKRSIYAATETFERMTYRDSFSFVHIMNTCSNKGTAEATRQKASHLGSQVAARLWRKHISRFVRKDSLRLHAEEECQDDLNNDDQDRDQHLNDETMSQLLPELPSRFYSAFLQAIRDLTDSQELRVSLFAECFEAACTHGKMNAVIMHEFLVHVNSEPTKVRFLGPYLRAVYGMQPARAAEELVRLVPSDWTVRSN